jgi:hypothetical protein
VQLAVMVLALGHSPMGLAKQLQLLSGLGIARSVSGERSAQAECDATEEQRR